MQFKFLILAKFRHFWGLLCRVISFSAERKQKTLQKNFKVFVSTEKRILQVRIQFVFNYLEVGLLCERICEDFSQKKVFNSDNNGVRKNYVKPVKPAKSTKELRETSSAGLEKCWRTFSQSRANVQLIQESKSAVE